MNLPFMKIYPSDLLGDPKFDMLDYEARGIFITLVMQMWKLSGEGGEPDCTLPDDDLYIQRLLRIRPAKWKKFRAILIDSHSPLLYVKDGRIYSQWLSELYARAKAEAEKRSQAGRKAALDRHQRERELRERLRQLEEKNGGITPENTGDKSKNTNSNGNKKQGDKNAKTPLEGHFVMRDACETHTERMRDDCQLDTRYQIPEINNIYNTSISPIGSVDGQAADESVSSVSSVNSGGNEKDSSLDAQARAFYEHYCRVWKDEFPRGPKLTPKRLRQIKARLRTFSLDDLIRACDNLHTSEWHRGENPNGKIYGTIDFLIRSDEQIDTWANNPPIKLLDKRRSQRNGVANRPPYEKIQYV